jgi:hypothetical protein
MTGSETNILILITSLLSILVIIDLFKRSK